MFDFLSPTNALNAFGNRIIFPAPERSYDKFMFRGNLYYVPWDPTMGIPNCKKTSPGSVTPAGPGVPCLWFPSQTSAATVILYLHGNAEDLGMCQQFLKHMSDQFRVNLLSMEYPGYGLLDCCYASEENMYLAAQTVLRFLVDDLDVKYQHIIIMGRSIGSGPACYLASKFPLGGLMLISPFASIKTAVQSVAGPIISTFFKERFSNAVSIRNVKCPTLLIHGKKDKLIPSEHSLELYRMCRALRKKLHVPAEMEHNSNLFGNADFLAVPCINFFGLPGYSSSRPPKYPQKYQASTFTGDPYLLQQNNSLDNGFFGICRSCDCRSCDATRTQEQIIDEQIIDFKRGNSTSYDNSSYHNSSYHNSSYDNSSYDNSYNNSYNKREYNNRNNGFSGEFNNYDNNNMRYDYSNMNGGVHAGGGFNYNNPLYDSKDSNSLHGGFSWDGGFDRT